MVSGSQASSFSNQNDRDVSTTHDEENPYIPEDSDSVVLSLRDKLAKLSPLSGERCIYRVPKEIYEKSEKSYTPGLLSIGPLHHGKPELQPMEEHKQMYLNDFLNRTKVRLEKLVGIVKKNEAALRNCYAETIGFKSKEFVEMIVVDAIFIIELLSKMAASEKTQNQTHVNDPIMHKPKMLLYIEHDLVMLENQIPFFILEELYSIDAVKIKDDPGNEFSLVALFYFLFRFFMCKEPTKLAKVEASNKIEHFLDLVRTTYLPTYYPPKKRLQRLGIRNLKSLEQAGVRFQPAASKSMLDIKFEDGILEIPQFDIYDKSEILIRNLTAFELCHYCEEAYLNHYFATIDCLVDSDKDVGILVRAGILEHWLGDDKEAADLLNNTECKIDMDNFYYADLFDKLDSFCKITWHEWKATLKREYFNTPWTIISVIVAFLLLVLTFIQTLCSILGL